MLLPIDENIKYLWDDDKKVAYDSASLSNDGKAVLVPFLLEDGKEAPVTAFEYYRPERSWYFKVNLFKEIIEDGITTGWDMTPRLFRQKNGTVEELAPDAVFPKPDPSKVDSFSSKSLELKKTADGFLSLFPTDAHGIKTGYCSHPMQSVTFASGMGDWVFLVGVKRDETASCLLLVSPFCETIKLLDNVRLVAK